MNSRNHIKVLRSKNAGPFVLTFDIVFSTREAFDLILSQLTQARLAKAFHVSPDDVLPIGTVDDLLAMKFSIRRARPSGHPGDSDCYGMNQEVPLACLVDELISAAGNQ